MIKVESIELSKNPVSTGENVIISVSVVTHAYLKANYTHQQLKQYTHHELNRRGEE